MGAELWHNIAPYQPDVQTALNELRKEVFRTGQYYLSELRPKSIDDAIRNGDAVGTRSVLDIEIISPAQDIEAIAPVPAAQVQMLFGTTSPTRQMVEDALQSMEHSFQVFLETYGRCEGFYIILYKDSKPSEILFAGWSAD